MDTNTQVQILDDVLCISNSSNNLGKGMQLTVLYSAIGKQLASLDSLTSLWKPFKEKKNSKFKLVNSLKIDLMSYPVRAKGLAGIYIGSLICSYRNFSVCMS